MNRVTTSLVCFILSIIFVFHFTGCDKEIDLDASCSTPCISGSDCPNGYFAQEQFPNPYGYQFNYMPDSTIFKKWATRGPNGQGAYGKQIREHAWNLWAGINQPSSSDPNRSIWQTWKTATQAFQDSELGQGKPITQKLKEASDYPKQRGEINRQAPNYVVPECIQSIYGISADPNKISVDGCRFQFNGDLMIAGVIYNEPAFNWIREQSNPLFLKSTLNRLLGEKKKDIPSFPSTSFVLKPMMWPVKQNGFTALPVWDNVNHKATTEDTILYAGFENKSLWKRAVAITANETYPATLDSVRFLHSVLNEKSVYDSLSTADSIKSVYKNVEVVNIKDNFYHWQISAEELAGMGCQDRLILDLSAWWTFGRLFEADDYIALVAMHIFTKETPDWTMQTAWWHDHPDTSRFSHHRPTFPDSANVKGPWNHYLMTTTYGQKEKPNRPHSFCNSEDGTDCWPVAYNPYIELGGRHPIATNCRNCHYRAGWTNGNSGTNYLAKGGPSSLAYFDSSNVTLFNNVIRTDFQWAIPDRVLPNPADPDKNN